MTRACDLGVEELDRAGVKLPGDASGCRKCWAVQKIEDHRPAFEHCEPLVYA